jgi:hypothetical protein
MRHCSRSRSFATAVYAGCGHFDSDESLAGLVNRGNESPRDRHGRGDCESIRARKIDDIVSKRRERKLTTPVDEVGPVRKPRNMRAKAQSVALKLRHVRMSGESLRGGARNPTHPGAWGFHGSAREGLGSQAQQDTQETLICVKY